MNLKIMYHPKDTKKLVAVYEKQAMNFSSSCGAVEDNLDGLLVSAVGYLLHNNKEVVELEGGTRGTIDLIGYNPFQLEVKRRTQRNTSELKFDLTLRTLLPNIPELHLGTLSLIFTTGQKSFLQIGSWFDMPLTFEPVEAVKTKSVSSVITLQDADYSVNFAQEGGLFDPISDYHMVSYGVESYACDYITKKTKNRLKPIPHAREQFGTIQRATIMKTFSQIMLHMEYAKLQDIYSMEDIKAFSDVFTSLGLNYNQVIRELAGVTAKAIGDSMYDNDLPESPVTVMAYMTALTLGKVQLSKVKPEYAELRKYL